MSGTSGIKNAIAGGVVNLSLMRNLFKFVFSFLVEYSKVKPALNMNF